MKWGPKMPIFLLVGKNEIACQNIDVLEQWGYGGYFKQHLKA
jgi:hypothetical protein